MDSVLIDWSSRHNLIAKSTVKCRWHRHFFDSAQIASLLPGTVKTIADLGSGAGFPGLILAAMLADKGVTVTLVESTGKKAAFLHAAAEAMGLQNVRILNQRIEATTLAAPPDIVTARALARLDKLLEYAQQIGGSETRYFFHKGQEVGDELTESANNWQMEVKRHKSAASPDGTILEIGKLARA